MYQVEELSYTYQQVLRDIFIKREDTQKNDNEDLNYWREKGTLELKKALNLQLNENVAKVILSSF